MTPQEDRDRKPDAGDAAFVPGIGYRYLNLSRKLGVAYGDVLNFVDWMDAVDGANDPSWISPTLWQQWSIAALNNDQKIAVQEERYMERERRHQLLAKGAECKPH